MKRDLLIVLSGLLNFNIIFDLTYCDESLSYWRSLRILKSSYSLGLYLVAWVQSDNLKLILLKLTLSYTIRVMRSIFCRNYFITCKILPIVCAIFCNCFRKRTSETTCRQYDHSSLSQLGRFPISLLANGKTQAIPSIWNYDFIRVSNDLSLFYICACAYACMYIYLMLSLKWLLCQMLWDIWHSTWVHMVLVACWLSCC